MVGVAIVELSPTTRSTGARPDGVALLEFFSPELTALDFAPSIETRAFLGRTI
jgi:hypothetical protein